MERKRERERPSTKRERGERGVGVGLPPRVCRQRDRVWRKAADPHDAEGGVDVVEPETEGEEARQ